MKILAVTCATGDSKLAKMTGDAIGGLKSSVPRGVELTTSVVLQNCPHELWEHVDYLTFHPKNEGFAFGMNLAIEAAKQKPDFVLCFNNDLEFPRKDWLKHLVDIAEARQDRIIVPATDRTALHKQAGPSSQPSFDTQEASAYCWLVPWAWCEHLKRKQGWWLFDPDFFAYGEDNWTAFLLSKTFGRDIFRMVPRSFVRHLRHQTSSSVKPDRRRSNRLLVDRLQGELKDPKLRPDLRAWARRYIAVLSKRL